MPVTDPSAPSAVHPIPERIRLRLHALRARFRDPASAWNIDALLLTHHADVSYLTDFSGEDSILVVTADRSILVTDFRYTEQANIECPWLEVVLRETKMTDALVGVFASASLATIGFDQSYVTVGQLRGLDKSLEELKRDGKISLSFSPTWVPLEGVTGKGRKVKDAHELRIIRNSIRVAEDAYNAFRPMIKVGMTENELAGLLLLEMRKRGAGDSSFPIIMAAGASSSLPHYRPREIKVQRDQPLLIDFGARYEGYCSDLSRTLLIGNVPAKIREIYQIVLDAQLKAIAALRPGLDTQAADAIARDHIAAHGYGEQFGHSLGHGIGRDIHEGPSLRKTPPGEPLEPGHIVTVEPGIYIPGLGGVRIEDDVLITERGCEVLSSLPKGIADCSIVL
jgi:Xaa-Pro aminopeptidase